MRLALVALAGLFVPGCAKPDCEALSDCEPNQICVDGLCHNRAGGRPYYYDGGYRLIDSGVAPDDAGGPDAGAVPNPGDAGLDADAGNGDAGIGALPIEGNLGFVWAGELFDGPNTSAFHAYGLLQRLDGATFTAYETSYSDAEGTTCLLATRRLTGGTIAGFDADSISVIPGPTAFSPFSMYPVGNGRFEPSQPPVQRIYSKSITAYFQIYGTGLDGSVESGLVGVPAPPFVFEDGSLPRGQRIALRPSPQLRWAPSNLSNGTITVELFDRVREVVLTCRVADDGAYFLPDDAISAFLGAQPMPEVYLEIRYDRETTRDATVRGGGALSVTYRTSQGLRYPVALP